MDKSLDVYLHGILTGQLRQDRQGLLAFQYDPSWLERKDAIPLSLSLPLRKEPFAAPECRPFFAGVLPDESQRELVARNLGVSHKSDFALLTEIGGECAGAVTLLPPGEPLPESAPSQHKLSPGELAEVVRRLPHRPLLAGDEGVRLSLAGAQAKLAVCVEDGEISIPLGGAPSTHILKPGLTPVQGLVANEAFCMDLARRLGIPVAPAELRAAEGLPYLLVRRYDRVIREGGMVERLHQEDFCQALGIPPEMKYQNGGGPSLKQCFLLLRDASSSPVLDLRALVDAVIFIVLIGNHDAHGKNFSLLHTARGTRLAPFYDPISTAHYPEFSQKMAMKVGSVYDSLKVFARHVEQMAEEAGLGPKVVLSLLKKMADQILAVLPQLTPHQSASGLPQTIEARIKAVQKRMAAASD